MAQMTRIDTVEELDELLSGSHERRLLIFKHSLACSISRRAYGDFRHFVEAAEASDGVVYTVVEIQNARPVSEAIEQRTGVRHESPQVLLVDGGRVTWHASHWEIDEKALRKALAS